MQLHELLHEKKGPILDQWIDCVLAEYHIEASKFFKSQKDQFANPLGYNTKTSLTKLYDIIIQDVPVRECEAVLEDFIKIKAVQDQSPSQSVSFIYILKSILRKECLSKEIGAVDRQLAELDARIDEIAMLVFDIYMACRERLYMTRLNEFKRGTHILTDGAVCPSALMKQNMQEQQEIKPFKPST